MRKENNSHNSLERFGEGSNLNLVSQELVKYNCIIFLIDIVFLYVYYQKSMRVSGLK